MSGRHSSCLPDEGIVRAECIPVVCRATRPVGLNITFVDDEDDKRGWRPSITSCFGLLGLLPLKEGRCSFSFREKGSLTVPTPISPFPTVRLLSMSENASERVQPSTEITHSEISSRPRIISDNDGSVPNSAVASRGPSLKRSTTSQRQDGTTGAPNHRSGEASCKTAGSADLAGVLDLLESIQPFGGFNAFASEGESREFASVTLTFLNSLLVVNTIANPIIYAMKS
ncbi:hypothetical protein L596_027453 [Steinernema carpocapsae]|uniref:Uncharacterized protein n=1 Tax=Steinernema carpocapsae TaxID=34508 RepID=A0A4U5LVE5_STECR|nr:hypothetical protein L596_027453 [Steinernema carpocapsae]